MALNIVPCEGVTRTLPFKPNAGRDKVRIHTMMKLDHSNLPDVFSLLGVGCHHQISCETLRLRLYWTGLLQSSSHCLRHHCIPHCHDDEMAWDFGRSSEVDQGDGVHLQHKQLQIFLIHYCNLCLVIEMAKCKTVVTPLRMHWSYHRLVQSHCISFCLSRSKFKVSVPTLLLLCCM